LIGENYRKVYRDHIKQYFSDNYTLELRIDRSAEAQNHITLESRDYITTLEPGIMLRYNRVLIYTLARAIVPRQNCDVIYANTADYSTLK